ncbi:LuxR C-terminal-related transcriptional regulator [Streptomyces sp. NBC_01304]|uniref:LuxR C-terminal-related transcriptional regulator n=1 Tax=Streptomyces sp. NBC_01304 TaxID=2903818 RepID=UPI002E1638C0|nr:LuxR C-terminal-related transcriptional regulator [Streptomyces sp. NBC_01304]
MGLLRPLAENPGQYAAVPPDIAASELVHPMERAVLVQQHTIAAVHEMISEAEVIYRKEHRESTFPVRVLHGVEVIRSALDQGRAQCRQEALTAQPGGSRPPETLARTLPHERELIKRGVKRRTLYQHSIRTHGPTLAFIEQITSAGAQVRTLNELFDRLIIYDRTVAFIPDSRYEQDDAALAIEHPAIVQYLIKVFNHAWQRAEPVTLGQDQQRPPLMTDETRRNVLSLMVEGHTDAAIGSRLGISARTVSSHIKKASDLVGGRSRAHLAYLLAKSDLLDGIPEDPASPA